MKQIIIYVCALFASLTFFSCSQDEEIYSCDKGINDWVKENLIDIQQMDRNDWLQLDEKYKTGAFIAFEPKQKQEFWLQKIQEVLTFDWNETEKEHLELLYQIILDNPIWFSKDRTEKEYEEYDLFQYEWIEYAQEQLGWSMQLIGAITATGNKMLNMEGELQFNTYSAIRLKDDSELPNCDCNQMSNFCPNQKPYCNNSSYKDKTGKKIEICKEKLIGCGFGLIGPCNGLCTATS